MRRCICEFKDGFVDYYTKSLADQKPGDIPNAKLVELHSDTLAYMYADTDKGPATLPQARLPETVREAFTTTTLHEVSHYAFSAKYLATLFDVTESMMVPFLDAVIARSIPRETNMYRVYYKQPFNTKLWREKPSFKTFELCKLVTVLRRMLFIRKYGHVQELLGSVQGDGRKGGELVICLLQRLDATSNWCDMHAVSANGANPAASGSVMNARRRIVLRRCGISKKLSS